jgi:hypothetical protein
MQLRLALDYHLLTDRTNFVVVEVRREEDKATQLPQLQKIAQMHAAGWGGVGSVVESLGRQRSVAFMEDLELDLCSGAHNALDVDVAPSTTRKSVDVRAQTQVAPIPPTARQVDVPPIDWTPMLRALDARYTASWLGKLPTSFNELRNLGVHEAILSNLDAVRFNRSWPGLMDKREQALMERELVHAFLAALGPWAEVIGVSRQLLRALRRMARDSSVRQWISGNEIERWVGKPPVKVRT